MRGSASLELALGILVLMVPLAVAVMSFGPWLERETFAAQVAAQASRSVVVDQGDVASAFRHAAATAANHGLEPGDVRVGLCGAPPVSLEAGAASDCPDVLQRGDVVHARVEVDVPIVVLPWIGGGENVVVGGVVAVAEHASLVDLYRSVGA